MVSSTHNHSTGSDGKLTPEEVVKKAISLGWKYVYFTDHYKTPENLNFHYFKGFFSDSYIKNILELKEKYKDKIKVLLGGEFDFIADYAAWTKNEIAKQDYDYVIGSLHKVKFKDKYFDPEPGIEEWIKNVNEFGGVEKFVTEYYKQVGLMIKSGLFDSVAHLDYVKIYNKDNKFFNEDSSWYKKEVLEVLDLIKKNKKVLEVNSGGIRKTGETFPSLWIIKEAKKRNIPITLGLDAHWETHYNNDYLSELVQIAKKAGYNNVVRFEKRKMIKESI
ncbi:MAG: histidinol-phosphatase [Candidatus Nanoarchaeia archaeon]